VGHDGFVTDRLPTTEGGAAAKQWADELAAWAIDPEILAAAPESPYVFPPALFAVRPDEPPPCVDVARDHVPPGGSVLDVGAGAGAASLPLFPPAASLHAVDSQPTMLDSLREAAAARDVTVTTYDGCWPDVAVDVPVCDVVVCSHVLYNVADVVPFVQALTEKARRVVVAEITAAHPLVRLAPLWRAAHGQPRPDGPDADLAEVVLVEAGLRPRRRDVVRNAPVRTPEQYDVWVDFTRRQLCLPPERRGEVEELLRAHPSGPRRTTVLWWTP
jgi:SAM-dependent methyltransferase